MQNAAEVYDRDGDDQYIIAIRPEGEGFRTRKFYCQRPICDIHEMAWALSMQCRFTGHLRERYSVAQHCLLVSSLMHLKDIAGRGGTPYEGLMHDAHEGYVSDLAAPWKVTVKDYRPFEHGIETAMREQFRLPPKISEGVKFADWLALYIEAETLLQPGITADWHQPEAGTREYALSLVRNDIVLTLPVMNQRVAYDKFIRRYMALKPTDL